MKNNKKELIQWHPAFFADIQIELDEEAALAQNLVKKYQEHKEDARYQAVLDAIIRANREKFEEVRHMCDALKELFEEEFAEAEQRGEARGEARGLAQINRLIILLSEQGRESDIVRAAKDEQFQQELLAEYNL